MLSSRTERKCQITNINPDTDSIVVPGPGAYNINRDLRNGKPNFVGFVSSCERGLLSKDDHEQEKKQDAWNHLE